MVAPILLSEGNSERAKEREVEKKLKNRRKVTMREVKECLMGISPVSNIRATYGAVGTAPHPGTQQPPKSSNSSQPADSVHLSAAAKVHLHADADGDGDGK